MRVHGMILAAGSGDRFGATMPKQFVRLAGEPILARSMRSIAAAGVEDLAVVAHPGWLAETRDLVESVGLSLPITIVPGGATRNESALQGLRSLAAPDSDIVVIHDAVRPLVPVEVILRSIEPVLSGRADATDTVIPSADTLVVVDGDLVVEIPERARYRRGQTPQTFRMAVITEAYRRAEAAGDLSATDDCSIVLRHIPGARIVAVAGDELNLKITTQIDIVTADRLLQIRTLTASVDPQPVRSLRDGRIYVAGGTDGIGRAIAEEGERLGARVVADGRRTGLDVRDYASVDARMGVAAEALGGLDHVVCSAGVLRIGSLAATSPAEIAEVIDANVTGTLNVARAAYPFLKASRGSFTAFASSSFTVGRPNYVPYSASKAAVANLVQGLAEEWASDGIRVNAVSPERTDTPMRRRAFPDEPRGGLLPSRDVALATLRLVASDLTAQVLDVRRHDATPAKVSVGPTADERA